MNIEAYRWMKEYINSPIEVTKEKAIKNLKRLGILDENGEIAEEYRDLVYFIKDNDNT